MAELQAPALFVAGNAAEAARFDRWLDEAEAEQVRSVDFDAALVVAVFSGMMGSGGHGVTVQEVAATPEAIRLTVALTQPADMAADVISYPYHIILLPRAELDLSGATRWQALQAGGGLLAEAEYQPAS